MDFAAYRKIDAVNWSSLREIGRSPRHYQAALLAHRQDTPAMAYGRALHAAILEPEEFSRLYVCWQGGYTAAGKPTTSRASGEYKAWAADNEDKQHITQDELARVMGAATAVRAHRDAADLVDGAQTEITAQWTDRVTGLRCKARLDIVSTSGRLADLKSTIDSGPIEFSSSVHRYGYLGQLAHYLAGAIAADIGVDPLIPPAILAVESQPPHDVVVYRIGPDLMRIGEEMRMSYLIQLAACRQAGSWPGHCSEGEIDLTLPAWARANKTKTKT